MFLNEKIVFFGPVHGKSPQSAKFAHAIGGSKKYVRASESQFSKVRSSKCYKVMKSGDFLRS
jgi:hypothetical protein